MVARIACAEAVVAKHILRLRVVRSVFIGDVHFGVSFLDTFKTGALMGRGDLVEMEKDFQFFLDETAVKKGRWNKRSVFY